MAKHDLAYWLKQKNMTPDQLMRKGARVPTDALARWARTGEPPREVTQGRMCLHVSIALGITPDQLDCGPRHRGLSIGPHEIVSIADNFVYTHYPAKLWLLMCNK